MGIDGLTRRAVFVDRDGVINRTRVHEGVTYPPASIDELEMLPGVKQALDDLAAEGYFVVMVTNQPDVARGTQSRAAVEAMHERLRSALPIGAVYACYHDDPDACVCRKPKPGLLLRAAAEHQLDLAHSFMIGDRWSDVLAGIAAGCSTVLLQTPHSHAERCRPRYSVASLAEAAERIIAARRVEDSPAVPALSRLSVKIFADGADLDGMRAMAREPWIAGFTTNPTLMRKAGVADYRRFAREVLAAIPDRPISLEVFADEFGEMERQAREIASWAPNVYVKIPVTNTRREDACPLIRRLAGDGIKVNVTALMNLVQVRAVSAALAGGAPSCVSVFAGRIADTGRDPLPIMASAVGIMSGEPQQELIWASPRELLNIFQADSIGCHIITVTNDVLAKLSLIGRDLGVYSLDTVKMFHGDASRAGFTL